MRRRTPLECYNITPGGEAQRHPDRGWRGTVTRDLDNMRRWAGDGGGAEVSG